MAQGSTVTRDNFIQLNGVTVSTGSGVLGTGTQRVVLATDQPVIPVSDNSGSLTVDNAGTFAVQATIAAGATSIGKAEDVASADADVGVGALAVRKASPANTSGTDGDYEFLQISAGRLWTSSNIDQWMGSTAPTVGSKTSANSIPVVIASDQSAVTVTQGTAAAITAGWPVIMGELGDTTGTLTTATQTNSITTGNIDGYPTVLVSLSGVYAGASGVFELSDDSGTTWFPVSGARMDTGIIEGSYTSLTNTNRSWVVTVAGADQFRVRSTSVTGGTVTVRMSVTSAPTNMVGSVQIGSPFQSGSVGTVETLATGYQELVSDKTVKSLLENLTVLVQAQNDALSIGGANTFRQLDNQKREVVTLASVRGALKSTTTTITASTAETTIIPATDPGISNDVYAILITNTSASTVCRVDIRDATAGTVRIQIQTVGGTPTNGVSLGGMFLTQSMPGQNWTATCGTSTTDIRITVLYTNNT